MKLMAPLLLLRMSYLGAALAVLIVSRIPTLRDRFLAYGARASATHAVTVRKDLRVKHVLITWLDRAAALRVPHNWFASFYAISVACSLFWAGNLALQGPAFRAIAAWQDERKGSSAASMSFTQVEITWAMMFVQGSRRLYECLCFARPSESQMAIVHWLLGISFYIATSMAIWIEGVPVLRTHKFSIARDLVMTPPSLRTFLSILVFIFASGFQHDCHVYLASLKAISQADSRYSNSHKRDDDRKYGRNGYKLPRHPAFHSLIAPHYTAECLIYLSLAFNAAPVGKWANGTLLCTCIFAVVNLGITAKGTKTWYESEFGKDAVASKWCMIPWLF